jgi:hypothetical protein
MALLVRLEVPQEVHYRLALHSETEQRVISAGPGETLSPFDGGLKTEISRVVSGGGSVQRPLG